MDNTVNVIDVPLVGEKSVKPGGATSIQTFANIVKVCLGSGLLAFPISFKSAGIIPCCAIIILASFWVYFSVRKLIQCQEKINSAEYRNNIDIPAPDGSLYTNQCYYVLGVIGARMFDILVCLALTGVGVVYVITSSSLLAGIDWSSKFLNDNLLFFVIMTVILVGILSLHRDMKSLSWASMVGNVAIFASLLLVTVFGIRKYLFKMDNINVIHPELTGLSKMFGSALFSYGIAFIALQSHEAMSVPKKFNKVMMSSVILLAFLYCTFGTLFYLIYSTTDIQGMILKNMDGHSFEYMASTVLICVMCIFSVPVAIYPAIEIVEKSPFLKDEQTQGRFVTSFKKIIFRIGLVLLIGLIAYLVPKFDFVVSLLGCLAISTGTFIFPPLLHFFLFRSEQTRAMKAVDIAMLIMGIVVLIFTTTMTILDVV